jgi:hypothetical protein
MKAYPEGEEGHRVELGDRRGGGHVRSLVGLGYLKAPLQRVVFKSQCHRHGCLTFKTGEGLTVLDEAFRLL